ncbi:MAG TPA: enoyl-CoA hydratase-related protein, partial [Hyphomicrobiaceae bacterium]|nr:enoyl-CoA hydratase-related protein [Hyphomicrobiaceae bacterium]
MTSTSVLSSLDARDIATVVLNRPEVGNAYNGELIEALLAALSQAADTAGLRALVVRGNGRHFQAGADLKWVG